jgi:hypothetical protein
MRDNTANNLFLFESCQLLIALGAVRLPRENLVQENASWKLSREIRVVLLVSSNVCFLVLQMFEKFPQ